MSILSSAAAAEVAGIDISKRSFRERFATLRPQVLHNLRESRASLIYILVHPRSPRCFSSVKYRFVDDAFKLAEEYQDYRSLADLCHSSPPIYPQASNIYSDRIEKYIEHYKEEFSDELYRWYIEHSMFIKFL